MKRSLRILGTRGIPARHGGFETFAEDLARRLAPRGWNVTVYCQGDGNGPVFEDQWEGIRRVHIPVARSGAVGTVIFDWKATGHAARAKETALVLGYNTACFNALLRWSGTNHLINMDGLEWRRSKYGIPQKTWLFINEVAGAWLGNHLIADHPEINRHLTKWARSERITTIPYGSTPVESADPDRLRPLGLAPNDYSIIIARPEPENSIKEMVAAYSSRTRRGPLVVLGDYDQRNNYHRAVLSAAGPQIHFPGAIYDRAVVESLRFHARLYLHGHTVGGTNPSLVEALGAGSPTLAHDNRFNRWVAGPEQAFFIDQPTCARQLDQLLDDEERLASMRQASLARHRSTFTLEHCLDQYEELLTKWTEEQPPSP